MAPVSRELISEITEISDNGVGEYFLRFGAATVVGALAGTIALTSSILLAEGEMLDLEELLEGLAFIFPFAGILTIGGMLLIGLPVTAVLRGLNREHVWLYALFGALAGFLIMGVIFGPPIPGSREFLVLAACGTFAGFVAALSWGRWREQVAKARRAKRDELAAQRRSNPIHDLIH